MAETKLEQVRGRDVLFVTLAIVALAGIGIATLLGLTGLLTGQQSANRSLGLWELFASLIIQNGAVLGAVAFVLIRVRGMTWESLGLRPPRLHWIVGAAIFGVILVATIEGIERLFGISIGRVIAWLIAPEGFTWLGLFGTITLIGLLTPFCEELYFRGLIYRWLRDRWGPALALPISALMFGGVHFYYPLPHMLLVALLGLIFAIAYERSGSLWVPVAIHAAQNTTVVAFIYWTLA